MKRAFFFTIALGLAACGGKAVIDPGSGSGGSGGTGTTDTGSTGGPGSSGSSGNTGPGSTGSGGSARDCTDLTQALNNAIVSATSCDTCDDGPETCQYVNAPLTDECGCPIPVDSDRPEDVSRAVEAYRQWTEAGCGPFECGVPCAVSSEPSCQVTGNGCIGVCGP